MRPPAIIILPLQCFPLPSICAKVYGDTCRRRFDAWIKGFQGETLMSILYKYVNRVSLRDLTLLNEGIFFGFLYLCIHYIYGNNILRKDYQEEVTKFKFVRLSWNNTHIIGEFESREHKISTLIFVLFRNWILKLKYF